MEVIPKGTGLSGNRKIQIVPGLEDNIISAVKTFVDTFNKGKSKSQEGGKGFQKTIEKAKTKYGDRIVFTQNRMKYVKIKGVMMPLRNVKC